MFTLSFWSRQDNFAKILNSATISPAFQIQIVDAYHFVNSSEEYISKRNSCVLHSRCKPNFPSYFTWQHQIKATSLFGTSTGVHLGCKICRLKWKQSFGGGCTTIASIQSCVAFTLLLNISCNSDNNTTSSHASRQKTETHSSTI